uniref:Uncharacterized protein n=1 Tax=viral metagenome TaxID=1070528 RepID=A0A6C0K0H8_9ZZZZ
MFSYPAFSPPCSTGVDGFFHVFLSKIYFFLVGNQKNKVSENLKFFEKSQILFIFDFHFLKKKHIITAICFLYSMISG